MTDIGTIRDEIATLDRRVDRAVAQLASRLPLDYAGTHTELGENGTLDHRQLHRGPRFDVLFRVDSIDRSFNPRSFVAIAPRRTPWVGSTGPWYWPSRLIEFLDEIEPGVSDGADRFDQQVAVLAEETARLETLMDHPPGALPWGDDFTAWRRRTPSG